MQLQKLEERKKIAVKNRDYESADILKKVTYPSSPSINFTGDRFVEKSSIPRRAEFQEDGAGQSSSEGEPAASVNPE